MTDRPSRIETKAERRQRQGRRIFGQPEPEATVDEDEAEVIPMREAYARRLWGRPDGNDAA